MRRVFFVHKSGVLTQTLTFRILFRYQTATHTDFFVLFSFYIFILAIFLFSKLSNFIHLKMVLNISEDINSPAGLAKLNEVLADRSYLEGYIRFIYVGFQFLTYLFFLLDILLPSRMLFWPKQLKRSLQLILMCSDGGITSRVMAPKRLSKLKLFASFGSSLLKSALDIF